MLATEYRHQKFQLRMEAEANEFAAHLLMPSDLCKKEMGIDADLSFIRPFEKKFGVSQLAAARRISVLSTDTCAVIVSKNGKFAYAIRDKSFLYITLQKNSSMPNYSLAYSLPNDQLGASHVEECDSSDWLNETDSETYELTEQVFIQGAGYRITLLKCEEKEGNGLLNELSFPTF